MTPPRTRCRPISSRPNVPVLSDGQPGLALSDQIAANKRRSILMVVAFSASVVALAWAFDRAFHYGVAGVVVALVVAMAVSFGAWHKSGDVALAMSRARPADGAGFARLHNLVAGLSVAAGVPKPRLYVVDDDARNAFAAGRDPRHAAVVVTTGLVGSLTRVELEGVLAHEISHVRNHDISVSTLAVTLVGLALVVVAPLRGRIMQLALNQNRELIADMACVSLTRYPPGLVSALEKLGGGHPVVHSASPATAHLWMASPLARVPSGGWRAWRDRGFDTHPPLAQRIAALREL